MRTVKATRYVTPLREGGSLPAIVEADDDGTYVLKFRKAAQGPRALVAEIISGELGRALGLPVPEIVLIDLDPVLGRSEPHQEIQDLIERSGGLNLALDYLPGSLTFDPATRPPTDIALASAIVWFDALISNVDRTARNPNMLVWHRQLYLIDHGASLIFHHSWSDYMARSREPFSRVKDHVLLSRASEVERLDEELAARLTPEILTEIVDLVPADWLDSEAGFDSLAAHREAYVAYLQNRLSVPRAFVEGIVHARNALV